MLTKSEDDFWVGVLVFKRGPAHPRCADTVIATPMIYNPPLVCYWIYTDYTQTEI